MYIAKIYVAAPSAVGVEWAEEINLPGEVETEEQAVNFLVDKDIERFTLYEVKKIGTYKPEKPKVSKID